MRYVVSDIHGDFMTFKKLMNGVNMDLDGEDLLYIAGDILDRGKDGLRILKYLESWIRTKSVRLIKGNHETFCQYYLEKKLSGERWSLYGGTYTLQAVEQLNKKEQGQLLEFLRGLPYYMEENLSDMKKCIITHVGVSGDWLVYNNQDKIDVAESIRLGVEMLGEYAFLIRDDIHDLSKRQMERFDKFVICGHVPTFKLQKENTVLRTLYYMDIDCGAVYRDMGGMLACYCLDSDEIFYV